MVDGGPPAVAPPSTTSRLLAGHSARLSARFAGGWPLRLALVDVSGPRARLLRRGVIDVDADLGDFEDATGGP